MNFLQSKIALFFILILFGQFSVFSQDLRQKAEENPLSTVFYLLSTTEKNSNEHQKLCLAESLARVERFGEIEDAAKMIEEGSYVDTGFINVINDLITAGKIDEASRLTSIFANRVSSDEELSETFFKPLILLKKDDEAKQIISKFDDSDKIDANFALAKVYLELGQSEKALEAIESIVNLIEKSKYDEDRAVLGFYYARLNKPAEALKFSQEAMNNLVWKTGKPEYTEGRILEKVVDTYRALGKDKEAREILEKQGESEELPGLVEVAESHFSKGERNKAIEILEEYLKSYDPKTDKGNFDFYGMISLYLKLGEMEKAENLTKNLAERESSQQKLLLEIADIYIENKNNSKASGILDFAFEQTKKIDIGKAEDGRFATSNKWNQAQYQSQIALRFIKMQSDKKALEIISQLKKPYRRALFLAEFVSANKNRIPKARLDLYLEEALTLLRQKKIDIFDSRKFGVYAVVARNFAEIGMPEKANDVFVETLTNLNKEMLKNRSDSELLYEMCSIGVDFDKSKIEPSEKLKNSLRQIIKSWENDEY